MSDNFQAERDVVQAASGSDRRQFFGKAAVGLAGAAIVAGGASKAVAQAAAPTPTDIFNFALNFEYLGAEFYLRAAYGGTGLSAQDTDGTGTPGAVTGGSQVPFTTNAIGQFARELARDEVGHVGFLRLNLGAAKIARPAIDLVNSFSGFAQNAGIVPRGTPFSPFASEANFLIGALLLEDVCVTALKGGTPFIRSSPLLESAAGFLATEAYHAGIIRAFMYMRGMYTEARQVSDLRDFYDGPSDLDSGIGDQNFGDLVPNDTNGIAFSRTPQQVLAIAYASPSLTPGGFFPNGVNGTIR